jgi:hypothetical protein
MQAKKIDALIFSSMACRHRARLNLSIGFGLRFSVSQRIQAASCPCRLSLLEFNVKLNSLGKSFSMAGTASSRIDTRFGPGHNIVDLLGSVGSAVFRSETKPIFDSPYPLLKP